MPLAVLAVVAVAASVYAGVKQSQAADYQEKVYKYEADAAQNKANYDANIHRDQVRRLLSTQRAMYGKSGVDMTGTPLLALQNTAEQGELDALAIRYGGDIESARLRNQGKIAKMQGDNAATASYIKAGTSLLSSGYSAYSGGK